eukprot:365277-Chlamydomonas_euryale.AAC.3
MLPVLLVLCGMQCASPAAAPCGAASFADKLRQIELSRATQQEKIDQRRVQRKLEDVACWHAASSVRSCRPDCDRLHATLPVHSSCSALGIAFTACMPQ